jgi:hypothetical protein
MSPINPTPYVIIYILSVFVLPWAICGSFVIRGLARARQLGVNLFSGNAKTQILELQKTDQILSNLSKNTRKWFVIVFISWIMGFSILVFTLYKLESANLLINHSKGIYGAEETK